MEQQHGLSEQGFYQRQRKLGGNQLCLSLPPPPTCPRSTTEQLSLHSPFSLSSYSVAQPLVAPYCHEEICLKKNKTLFRLCSPVFSHPTDSSQDALFPAPTRPRPPSGARLTAHLLWETSLTAWAHRLLWASCQPPPPLVCSARGVLEDCWGLFQSSDSRGTGTESRACERQLAVECDLLEGVGGETEPPWWG